jgi:DNA mismatch repair protein MutS
MDEVGRGTSTFDGLSLAWAAARHIAQKIGAFTLFATHYFELTTLPEELPACRNVHLDATEHGRELIFLHAVKPGPASQSYGLHVAELAGVPRDVVERARAYLRRLEKHQQALLPASPQTEIRFEATAGPTPEQQAVLDKLTALEVDNLTPRAALDLVYELARLTRN